MRFFRILLLLTGLPARALAQDHELPAVNRRILEYVQEQHGRKVGRGECWDLAAAALDRAGAKWDGDHGFGRELDLRRDSILPGDIVQFEGAEFQWKEGNAIHTSRMPHHTAVVVGVLAPGVFTMAEQNTQATGRKVGFARLDLSQRTKGSVRLFRPVAISAP